MQPSEAITTIFNMLDSHGLVAKGWTCKLSNTKHILGQCSYRDKSIRLSRIHIAMGNDTEILNTIRHEVAHAITGPGHGHGQLWKQNAMLLGARPKSTAKLSYEAPHRYEIQCQKCERVLQKRHRRMSEKRIASCHCARCGPEGRIRMITV